MMRRGGREGRGATTKTTTEAAAAAAAATAAAATAATSVMMATNDSYDIALRRTAAVHRGRFGQRSQEWPSVAQP